MSEHAPRLVISESVLVGEGLSAYESYSIVQGSSTVQHRYSDFEWLRSALIEAVPSCIVPPLPPKTYLRPAVTAFFYSDEDFMEARRRGLEEFLIAVLEHPRLRDCECLRVFLSGNDQQFQALKSQSATEASAWTGKIAAFGLSLGKTLSGAISRSSFPLKLESDRKFEAFLSDLQTYRQNSEDFLTQVNSLISHSSNYSQSLFASGQVLDAITRSSTDRELAVLTGALMTCGIEVGQDCVEQATRLKCVLKFRLETIIRELEAAVEAIQRREKWGERLSEEYTTLSDKKMRMMRDKYMEMDVRQQEERLEGAKTELEDFSRRLEEEVRAFLHTVHLDLRKVVSDMAEIHIQFYSQTAAKWGRVKQRSPAKASSKAKPDAPTRSPPVEASPPPEEAAEMRKAALEQEIRSKERTLELLNAKLPRDSQELVEQLVARDRRIEELSDRVLALEAAASGSADALAGKNQQLAKLQDERSALHKEVAALQSSLAQMQAQVQAASSQLREERASVKAKVAEAKSEAELLNSQLLAQTDQTQKMKSDIAQLSKIIRDMSQLNADLNEKVVHMNKDMELKNKEHYTATVRAQHFDELEQALVAEKAESAGLRKKVQKMLEDRSKVEMLEELSRLSQDALRGVEESLAKASEDFRPLLEAVQKVRHDLKKATAPQKNILDDPVLLKQEVRDLKATIAELKLELRKQTAANETHLARIQTVEQEKVSIRREMDEAIERLDKRTKVMQEGLDKFRMRTERAEEELQRLESEHTKTQNLMIGGSSQVTMLKAQLKEAKANEERAEAAFKDIKDKLAKMKLAANAQELSILSREAKLRQTATKLKLLSDEVWKKDTEMLKKDAKLIKLQEEIAKLTETNNRLQAETKVKSAQDSVVLEQQLTEKDQEIAMLKEMLRSSSKQVQHKEVDLSRFKRKLESLSAAPVDPSVTAFVERVDDLLDLREKVRTSRGKVPAPLVKKKLEVDNVPGSKEEVNSLISAKIAEAAAALERDLRVSTKVNISEYLDRVSAPELKSILSEDQPITTVGRLATKCRNL